MVRTDAAALCSEVMLMVRVNRTDRSCARSVEGEGAATSPGAATVRRRVRIVRVRGVLVHGPCVARDIVRVVIALGAGRARDTVRVREVRGVLLVTNGSRKRAVVTMTAEASH